MSGLGNHLGLRCTRCLLAANAHRVRVASSPSVYISGSSVVDSSLLPSNPLPPSLHPLCNIPIQHIISIQLHGFTNWLNWPLLVIVRSSRSSYTLKCFSWSLGDDFLRLHNLRQSRNSAWPARGQSGSSQITIVQFSAFIAPVVSRVSSHTLSSTTAVNL